MRQLEKVSRLLLAGLARRAPLLPGAGQLAFVDIDSTQRRVYGYRKQGAAFGNTKIAGKTVLVRGLNALTATLCTPGVADHPGRRNGSRCRVHRHRDRADGLRLLRRRGLPEKATRDYVRHGTITLFAALEVATSQVTDACYPTHRHQELLRFIPQGRSPPPAPAASCMSSAHLRHPQAPRGAGLAGEEPAGDPPLHPTGRSWLNMERCFAYLTGQMIRRGAHKSGQALEADIRAWVQN